MKTAKLFYDIKAKLFRKTVSCPAVGAFLSLTIFSTFAGAANLVLNGNFEDIKIDASSEFGDRYPSQQVANWTTDGYNFVFKPGTADTTGAPADQGQPDGTNTFRLWGPGNPKNPSNNGLTATSPTGGNFLGLEADLTRTRDLNRPVKQQITGLIPGQLATLSFYWAGSQQYLFDGDNSEWLQISLGGETKETSRVENANHGFTGWQLATMTFTPNDTSLTLAFLAQGKPAGLPPFVLLDGVTLTQGSQTPEPATWSLVIGACAGAAGLVRFRRRTRIATNSSKDV